MWYIFLFLIYFLTSVGAINWGLVAFFNFNLVDFVSSFFEFSYDLVRKIIYGIVAVCGFITLFSLFWR